MKHETITAAEPVNLFAAEPMMGRVADPKPRQPTAREVQAYARFLAHSRGLPDFEEMATHTRGDMIRGDYRLVGVTFGAEIDRAANDVPAQYEEGAYSIPVPGGRTREAVTLEQLDEAGAVVSRSTLPTDGKRAIPWKKDAVARAVGPVAKVKRAPKPKPAMSDRDAMRAYCEARAAEIEAEKMALIAGLRTGMAAIAAAAEAAANAAPAPSNVIAVDFSASAREADEAVPEKEYSVTRAPYSRGNMLVHCPSGTGYKTRAARLIGDGLNCRWVGRGQGYVASPAKVAKFEALYAAGFDASTITGKIYHSDRPRENMTVREAIAAMPENPPVQPQTEPEVAMEPEAPEIAPAPVLAAPAAMPEEQSDGLEEAGEVIGGLIADLYRRIQALEDRLAASSRECDPPSAETDAVAPLPADPRARAVGKARLTYKSTRSPARERLLRHCLAMRAERAEQRRQFAFGMAQYEEVKAELAATRKPLHQNEPAPDLVAQLHRERDETRRTLNEATNRAEALERAVDRLGDEVQALSGRAHRAEAALRLERAGTLPRIAHAGTPAARVSFQMPAIGRVQ